MTIDDIEKLAASVAINAPTDVASDPHLASLDAQRLARFILAVLPTLRAVECVEVCREDTSGSGTAYDAHTDALWELHKAAVAMRSSLGGKT